MTNPDKLALVWAENVSAGPWSTSPRVSVTVWSDVLERPWLRWKAGEMPDLSGYDAFLVNLFQTEDSTHIEQLRSAYPNAFIIAAPDPPLDVVLHRPDCVKMLRQMQFADVICGRTPYDCQIYGSLLNKPTAWLPSPIGPMSYFEAFRDSPKDNYILSLDHPLDPYSSMQNVAALALLQREYDLEVIYAAARPATREYAELAGLEAEWPGEVPFDDFVGMTARARMCVDIYARHSYGRHSVLCAMVGTPYLGSDWTPLVTKEDLVGGIDPFKPKEVLRRYQNLCQYSKVFRDVGYMEVERLGYERSRWRLQSILETYQCV